VDQSLSCVFGCLLGGLNNLGCHAAGSMAAYHCAAAYGDCCTVCGGNECEGCDTGGYFEGDVLPAPSEPSRAGTPQEAGDPFTDEPSGTPQARRIPTGRPSTTRGSVRYLAPARGNLRPAPTPPYYRGGVRQSHFVQRADMASQASHAAGTGDRAHLVPRRTVTIRR
jgi:hypothetical protein